MSQRDAQRNDPNSTADIELIDSVEELLDLSRRKSGKFRAWSDMAPAGMCELIAEGGELRRARCEEFFGEAAVDRITRIHLPLRVERVEEKRERRRSRGPYYANEDEATFRMTGGHPRS